MVRARVVTCSALDGTGVPEVWAAVEEFRAACAGALPQRRAEQARDWLWSEITESLTDALRADPEVADLARQLESAVAAGTTHTRPRPRAPSSTHSSGCCGS